MGPYRPAAGLHNLRELREYVLMVILNDVYSPTSLTHPGLRMIKIPIEVP